MSAPAPTARRVLEVGHRVLVRLREAGYEAYFVGGVVRDRLLARPSKDIDIATSATPDDVATLFSQVIMVGAQFGVCRVRLQGIEIEVATFRTDQGYADGRHPEDVRFTNAREDVLRRDFTINGMLYDPLSDEVIDHVGGRADLDRRVVRAIGDAATRFAEDRLRMLRAVRFAARLSFSLDDETADAIRRHAHRIVEVSAERMRDELSCIVTEGQGARGLALLRETGLLPHVLPELSEDGVGAAGALLAALGPCDSVTGFSALLHSLDADETRALCRRLRLSRQEIRTVTSVVADLEDVATAVSWPPHRSKRFLRQEHAPAVLAIAHAGVAREAAAHLQALGEDWRPDDLRPAPLLDGRDLARLGYERGPRYKEMLAFLEDEQLDGRIRTPEEAEASVRERFPPK